MSKYVTHKHGLNIGSDNIFFVIDSVDADEPELILPEGVANLRDGYRAIVSFMSYHFDQSDMLNVFIETPASQLVWSNHKLIWEELWEREGKESYMIPHEKTYYKLKPWFETWLNKNVGPKYEQWDTYTRNSRSGKNLFFKKRKDALAFVRLIDLRLKGIKMGDF
jgi:hypothetical protein